MELKTFSNSGDSSVTVEVSDATFSQDFNESLVHQVIVAYMAAGRSGTKAQKNRAAVRGGGAKPWRQKGTGRARAGTIRSPLWRGGGKTFAAVPRDYEQKVNRKMYRSAMRSILSELVRQDRLVVVDDFSVESPKTKQLVTKLQGMGINNCLIVAEQVEENLMLSSRNLIDVDVCAGSRINPVSLVRFDKVLITTAALKQVEEGLS